MMRKEEIIEKLREYFEQADEVIFAYLFGSYAKGKEKEESDIDVAIYIDENFLKDKSKVLDLQTNHALNLCKIFRKEVDLVILNEALPLLRHEVISEGILVIEKDHEKLVEFKKRSFYYYQDWLNIMNVRMMYIKERLSSHGEKGDS